MSVKVCFEIINVGKAATKEDVISKLAQLGVGAITKVTKADNCSRVYLSSNEEKAKAMRLIAETPFTTDQSSGPWQVKSVYIHQPRTHLLPDKQKAFAQKTAGEAVAPWKHLPYPEQLERKQRDVAQALEKFTTLAPSPIRASPALREYRNKLDFTIGMNGEGKPCAGFRVGAFKQGGVSSFRVDVDEDCLLTSPRAGLEVAKFLSDFMQTESKLPVYDQHTHLGFWRALMVRYSEKTNQLLIILRACPGVEGGEEEMKRCVEALEGARFVDGTVRITACYWQWWEGIAFQAPSEDSGFELCFGSAVLEEEVLGMRFQISPGAFFQVNTPGCEVMFGLIRDMLPKSNSSLLLDVCCGTGAIGLLCASQAKLVAGVELSPPAVLDARRNAKLNHLESRCKFICAKAESVFSHMLTGEAKPTVGKKDSVLDEEDQAALAEVIASLPGFGEIIAVVDPPRAGLHPSVLKAMLRCKAIDRIIYVSCNPTGSFIDNATALCGTQPIMSQNRDVRAIEGILPFEPVQFIPLDMFPHTEHCELIAEFRRTRKEEGEEDAKRVKQG